LSVLDLAPIPEGATAGDAYPYTSLDRGVIRSRQASNIVGSAETVRRGLTELLAATDADELMITTMVHDPADRLHSLELVANMASRARAQDAAGLISTTADLGEALICRSMTSS
jgi:alkanesulfonate monooxygenase SsuD/methylene tetrahydromethanopterin reductase-like flavin-dependent oxidoreductase (luciferase family)